MVCRGIKPRFLVEPQSVEFQRKIITTADKCFPSNFELLFSNPEKRPTSWRIDDTELKNDKIFSIHPLEGRVDPGQTTRIKVSFNPLHAGIYQRTVKL